MRLGNKYFIIYVLIVMLSFGGIIYITFSSIYNQHQQEQECINLGFDSLKINYNSYLCYKNIDFDITAGEYIRCYMPVEVNIPAEKWCENEKTR
jgi:hypothetical protein